MTIHHINATTTKLVRVARKMERELQELVDNGKERGVPMPWTEALLDEWRTELRDSGYVLSKKHKTGAKER